VSARSEYPLLHPLERRSRTGIVGKTGMGKSTLMKELARREMKAGQRVVAFDPHDEYSVEGIKTDAVELGPLTRRVTVAELVDLLADGDELLADPRLALAVVPEGEDAEEIAEEFKLVANFVKNAGNLTFLVDELGDFQECAQFALNRVVTGYRKFGVAVVYGAQRMVQIPKTSRTQLSDIVSFLQDDDEDLAALVRRTRLEGFDAEVLNLTVGQFKHWRDTRGAPAASHRRRTS
jgi:energy-coupling factor transporter ATP-binding protein EcfA2